MRKTNSSIVRIQRQSNVLVRNYDRLLFLHFPILSIKIISRQSQKLAATTFPVKRCVSFFYAAFTPIIWIVPWSRVYSIVSSLYPQ